MNKEHSPIKSFKEKLMGNASWEFGKTLRATEENKDCFKQILNKLQTNSLLIYFNHFNLLDPTFILRTLDNEKLLDKTHIFISQKHLDYGFQCLVTRSVSEKKGFGLLPVVQNKDRDSYEDYTEINRRSLQKAAQLLRTKGNIVIIAPEGQRSKTGQLIRAADGMEGLFKIARETTLAYPIAIEHGKVLPVLTDTKLIYSKLAYSYDEIKKEAKAKEESVTFILMEKLSCLLPFKNRGVYR